MKKYFLIFLTSIIVLSFSGCDIPFYTQYQLKTYLHISGENFNSSKEKFNNIEEAFLAEDVNYQKTKTTIDEGIVKIKSFQQIQTGLNVPEKATSLNDDLKTYYQELTSYLEEIQIMVDFLYLIDKTSTDFTNSANKIPSDLSGSTNKLLKEFIKSQKEYKDLLTELQNKEVPEYFYQAKISLIAVVDAYNDYLISVIKGLKTKNSQYFDVDQFMRQMDDGVYGFTYQLENIEKDGDFEGKRIGLNKKIGQIESEIANLKSAYKIK